MNLKSAIIIAAAVLLAAGGVIVQKEIHKADAMRSETQRSERVKLKSVIEKAVSICNDALLDIRSDSWALAVQSFQVSSYTQIGKLDDWMNANQKDPLIDDVLALRNELEGFRHQFTKFDPSKAWPPLPEFARKLKDFANKL